MHRLSLVAIMISLFSEAALGAEATTGAAKFLPPDDQEKIRTERAFTVGIPLVEPYNLPGHLQWRPTGSFLIGAGYDSSLKKASDADLGDGYEMHAAQHSAALYVQYYPIKQSGFNLGLGGEARFGSFTVAKTTPTDPKGVLAAKGKYTSVYGGPTFGWSWIWNNGITFGFDLSKRKRFRGQATVQDLLPGNPATLGGDALAKVAPDTVAGTFMLGYSF